MTWCLKLRKIYSNIIHFHVSSSLPPKSFTATRVLPGPQWLFLNWSNHCIGFSGNGKFHSQRSNSEQKQIEPRLRQVNTADVNQSHIQPPTDPYIREPSWQLNSVNITCCCTERSEALPTRSWSSKSWWYLIAITTFRLSNPQKIYIMWLYK